MNQSASLKNLCRLSPRPLWGEELPTPLLCTMKPIASLSLDLDNKWSYMKTHGDPGWDSYPSYLDLVVPRFLEMLRELDLKITVFIVGQDAAEEKNHSALASITREGHEVGNHSFHHEPWLHLYTAEEIERELTSAEETIERVTGSRPIGFRGPGYSFSPEVLRVLVSRGYLYDASTFPTFLGPLARAYYFFKSRLPPAETLFLEDTRRSDSRDSRHHDAGLPCADASELHPLPGSVLTSACQNLLSFRPLHVPTARD